MHFNYAFVAKNQRNDIGEHCHYSLAWRLFAHRIGVNPFVRLFKLKQQNSICPCCSCTISASLDTHLHHVDYDHECKTLSILKIETGAVSKRTGIARTKSTPDCERCLTSTPEFFASCMSKLVLVHRSCHGTLHREKSKALA
jgi:hypothetical protein